MWGGCGWQDKALPLSALPLSPRGHCFPPPGAIVPPPHTAPMSPGPTGAVHGAIGSFLLLLLLLRRLP